MNELTDTSIWPAQERSAYAAGWNDRQHEIERLRAALKPFTTQIELIECTSDHTYSDDTIWPLEDCFAVTLGDLRRARTAYGDQQTAEPSK